MRELGVTFDLSKDRAISGASPGPATSCRMFSAARNGRSSRAGCGSGCGRSRRSCATFTATRKSCATACCRSRRSSAARIFQRPAVHLETPRGRYLHLGAICLKRDQHGTIQVSSQHFGQAPGISYMVQNRRLLARVAPETFSDLSVASIAETPTSLLEALRETADVSFGEPLIVMLSPGPGNAFYTEHSFLARRMGVPLVQGGDLLVLDDHVYLKTIGGLERVHVIYNRVADQYLDPLVLERGSLLGVPGLVHCIRKKTVSLVNALGSQLADDRALLGFALAHHPVLPRRGPDPAHPADVLVRRPRPVRTRPRQPRRIPHPAARGRPHLRQRARTVPTAGRGKRPARGDPQGPAPVRRAAHRPGRADALLRGGPPGRTPAGPPRVRPEQTPRHRGFPRRADPRRARGQPLHGAGLGGGSKDTWVLSADAEPITLQSRSRRGREMFIPPRRVTSRVAEVFYWMGRYLERANNLAYLVQVIETLELEELNATERKLYRPMWNRLLPHLEGSGRRSIATPCDRYRLVLQKDEPGALINVLRRAMNNAGAIQDALSPEAWSALNRLRATFANQRFQEDPPVGVCTRVTRKLGELATHSIAQFFGLAESSMMDDDGWRFCRLGQQLERAIITANAPLACAKAFTGPADQPARIGPPDRDRTVGVPAPAGHARRLPARLPDARRTAAGAQAACSRTPRPRARSSTA